MARFREEDEDDDKVKMKMKNVKKVKVEEKFDFQSWKSKACVTVTFNLVDIWICPGAFQELFHCLNQPKHYLAHKTQLRS